MHFKSVQCSVCLIRELCFVVRCRGVRQVLRADRRPRPARRGSITAENNTRQPQGLHLLHGAGERDQQISLTVPRSPEVANSPHYRGISSQTTRADVHPTTDFLLSPATCLQPRSPPLCLWPRDVSVAFDRKALERRKKWRCTSCFLFSPQHS